MSTFILTKFIAQSCKWTHLRCPNRSKHHVTVALSDMSKVSLTISIQRNIIYPMMYVDVHLWILPSDSCGSSSFYQNMLKHVKPTVIYYLNIRPDTHLPTSSKCSSVPYHKSILLSQIVGVVFLTTWLTFLDTIINTLKHTLSFMVCVP